MANYASEALGMSNRLLTCGTGFDSQRGYQHNASETFIRMRSGPLTRLSEFDSRRGYQHNASEALLDEHKPFKLGKRVRFPAGVPTKE